MAPPTTTTCWLRRFREQPDVERVVSSMVMAFEVTNLKDARNLSCDLGGRVQFAWIQIRA